MTNTEICRCNRISKMSNFPNDPYKNNEYEINKPQMNKYIEDKNNIEYTNNQNFDIFNKNIYMDNQNMISNTNKWQNTFPFDTDIKSNNEIAMDNANGYLYSDSSNNLNNEVYAFEPRIFYNIKSNQNNNYYGNNNLIDSQFKKHNNGTNIPLQNMHYPDVIVNSNKQNMICSNLSTNFPFFDPFANNVPPILQDITSKTTQNVFKNESSPQLCPIVPITNQIELFKTRRRNYGVHKCNVNNISQELDKKEKNNQNEKLRRDFFANCFKTLETLIGLKSDKRISQADILKYTKVRLEKLNKQCIEQDIENQNIYKRAKELIDAIREMRKKKKS